MRNRYREILLNYIPENSVNTIVEWIIEYKIHLKISNTRETKFGDYQPPQKGKGHKISVNNDLNKYNFLITLVHEIAHLVCFNEGKWSNKPHGKYWKYYFVQLMIHFLNANIFPEDVLFYLKKYLKNPKASTSSDVDLMRVLIKYNKNKEIENIIIVDEIPIGSEFIISNGRVFRKLEKLRTRYKCMELSTKKIYLFNPLINVLPYKN